MTARNYYHVGILVDDIVAAPPIAFSAITRAHVSPPVEDLSLSSFRGLARQKGASWTSSVCYSTEGPAVSRARASPTPKVACTGRQGG